MQVFKVVYTKDNVETVYLVAAETSRKARAAVLDTLYERRHFPYAGQNVDLSNDHFGLKRHVVEHGSEWTDYALMRDHGCSCSATSWSLEEPYRLYALNTATGEMVI